MGKHKVEIGLAATATILAIGAITASVLTGGIAAIIIGAVVGGAALAIAAGWEPMASYMPDRKKKQQKKTLSFRRLQTMHYHDENLRTV